MLMDCMNVFYVLPAHMMTRRKKGQQFHFFHETTFLFFLADWDHTLYL